MQISHSESFSLQWIGFSVVQIVFAFDLTTASGEKAEKCGSQVSHYIVAL